MERQQHNPTQFSSQGGGIQGTSRGVLPQTTFSTVKSSPMQTGGNIQGSSQLTGLTTLENLGASHKQAKTQHHFGHERLPARDFHSVNYSSMRHPYYRKWSIFRRVGYNQATGIPRKRILGPTTFLGGVDGTTLMNTFWLKGQPNQGQTCDNFLLVRIEGLSGVQFQQNYDLKHVPRLVRFRLRLDDNIAAISDALPSDFLWRRNRPLSLIAVLPLTSLQQQQQILRIELLDGTERVENLEERPLITSSIDGFLEVLPGSHEAVGGVDTGSSFYFKKGHILGLANIDISNLRDGHRSELKPGYHMSGPLLNQSFLHCILQVCNRPLQGKWLSPARETSEHGITTEETADQRKRSEESSLCNLWQFLPTEKLLLFK